MKQHNLSKKLVKRNILLFVSILIYSLANGQTLELTPNECFFSPTGTLENIEDPSQTGTEANKGSFFTHISSWSNLTDTILWAIDISNPGTLSITPWCGVPTEQQNSTIDIILGDETQTITLPNASGFTSFTEQETATFTIPLAGRYILKIKINSPTTTGNVADIQKLVLSGDAINGASTVIRRWRPYAVHTKWGSTANPSTITLAIHENTIITKDVDMYQPITTPFGYVGSTWDKEKQQFNGFNFSLWSYSANEAEPPIEQLSHLIAVGKDLTFGEYGHEGTGVKPRGETPYEGYHGNTQVIALRKVPGIEYDTYYSYYLDPITGHWKLWGCGKKYNSSGNTNYLWTGAFIEQPGAANKERSGDKLREVNYQGWYMDKDNVWYNIDQMQPGGDLSNISFKKWGKTENNSFLMQMGGFGENNSQPSIIELDNLPSVDERPAYLKGEFLNELYALPAEINTEEPKTIQSDSCVVHFEITDAGTNVQGELFWGTKEALTFDYKWENKKNVSIATGENEFAISNLIPGQKYYYRLRVTNNEGITWSMDTQVFTTTVPEGTIKSDFKASKTSIFPGGSIAFSNTSIPINDLTFLWTFEGGQPANSTERHPAVSYPNVGTYDVSLQVTNSEGTDTKTINDYISVVEGTGYGPLQIQFNFDNNIFDNSSYQRDLSTVGSFSPTFESDRNSNPNSSYEVPGNNDQYLEANYKGVAANGKRTVTAWFKTSDSGPTRKTMVAWGRNKEGEMFNVMLQNDGTIRVEAGSCSVRSTVGGLNDNNWHHVAVSFDPDDGDKLQDINIYIDGALDNNQADSEESYRSEQVSIDTDTTENNIRIGAVNYANYYWTGSLEDVRIYNTCLQETEVRDIFDHQTGILSKLTTETVQFYSGKSMIRINMLSQKEANVQIYNTNGSLIGIKALRSGINQIPMKQGTYIARVITKDFVESELVLSY